MRSFFGAALLGCGVLIAALSGLCTLMAVGGGLFGGGGGDIDLTLLALGIGGVPCVIGVGMIWLGRRQLRAADREAREKVQSDVFD